MLPLSPLSLVTIESLTRERSSHLQWGSGALGRAAATGPIRASSARMGGTWQLGRAPLGKSKPRKGCAGCRRPWEGEAVCESQTRPEPGVAARGPRRLSEGQRRWSVPAQGDRAVLGPTSLRRRPQPLGEGAAPQPPTATSAQPIATPPFVHPEANKSVRKKKLRFFGVPQSRQARLGPRGAPDAVVAERGVVFLLRATDCAVGSG